MIARDFRLLREMATVENEDLPMPEGASRAAPAQAAIYFGCNEPALQHFHRSVKQALGMPTL